MTNAFAAALDAMYADPNMAVDALWKVAGAGAGTAVRIIVDRAPVETSVFKQSTKRATHAVRVRKSQAPGLAANDTLTRTGDGAVFRVADFEPDDEEIEWVCQANRT